MGLVISRRIGEQVTIFKKPGVSVLTLTSIEYDKCYFTLEHIRGETINLRLGKNMTGQIYEDVIVKITEVRSRQCKMAFDAPDEVTILRSELEDE